MGRGQHAPTADQRAPLFYFKRTTTRRGGEVTTEIGVGSSLVRAVVALVLALSGSAFISIPSLMSLWSRFAR